MTVQNVLIVKQPKVLFQQHPVIFKQVILLPYQPTRVLALQIVIISAIIVARLALLNSIHMPVYPVI